MRDIKYYLKKQAYFLEALRAPSCRGYREMLIQAILYCRRKVLQLSESDNRLIG